MTDLKRGDRVYLDRSVPAVFVRYAGAAAVVQIGLDTRVVDPIIISKEEV
jgi:hypothetical protein